MSRDGRLLSSPLGVEWAGWRSDTWRLQQQGWQLAVSMDAEYSTYELLMRHETLKLYAMSDRLTVERCFNFSNRGMTDLRNEPVFVVRHVAPLIQIQRIPSCTDLSSFQEIDATPSYTTEPIRSIEDFNIFASKRVEDLFVDKADMSVIEHLEAIKRLQAPKQQELRQKERTKTTLVARLVHLEAA